MVSTIKFSQFANGIAGDPSNRVVGLTGGLNSQSPPNYSWTTSTRPLTPDDGTLGYNVTFRQYEYWDDGSATWVQLSAGTAGTVTSITAGTGLSGGVITTTGTIAIANGGVGITQIAANSGQGIPVQIVFGSLTTTTSIASVTPISTGVTATITPSQTTSKILIMATINFGINLSDNGFLQIVRGSTPIGIGTAAGGRTICGAQSLCLSATTMAPINLLWEDNPSTTSPLTYTIEAWTSGGNQSYINRTVSDPNTPIVARAVSTIILMEIK